MLAWRFCSCLLSLLAFVGDNGLALASPTASTAAGLAERSVKAVPVAVEEKNAEKGASRRLKRHADFKSVRTRLLKDHSGAKGDPKEKYFHEATFHPHYDGRFADTTLPEHLRHKALIHLTQTYLSTMASLGALTWLMHGSLLGWWWNRAIMPWDSDIDVMTDMRSMRYLAAYHNMTVHHFRLPSEATDGKEQPAGEDAEEAGEMRDYLLEINPHYANGSVTDKLNVIDARWIDTQTGLFIDITTLRPNWTARASGVDGAMMVKDRHHYLEQDIFPLRSTTFEGMPVMVPYAYSELLEEEYGRKALTSVVFENHVFEEQTGQWRQLAPRERAQRARQRINSRSKQPKSEPAMPDELDMPYGRGIKHR